MTQPDDRFLTSLFEEVRSNGIEPSDDLIARVLKDAADHQPSQETIVATRPTFWDRFSAAIGGWPALSGVTAAGVAGLWIGLVPPDFVDDWVSEALGTTTSVSFTDNFTGFEEGALDG